MSHRFVDSLRAGPGWNAEICYDARSLERKILLHFLNCSSFSKYLNAKGGFALYFEPLYIRACTVHEIKLVPLLSPAFRWTRRLIVHCNEIIAGPSSRAF